MRSLTQIMLTEPLEELQFLLQERALKLSHEKFTAHAEPPRERPTPSETTEEVAHDSQEADPRACAHVDRRTYRDGIGSVRREHLPGAHRSDPRSSNSSVGCFRFRSGHS